MQELWPNPGPVDDVSTQNARAQRHLGGPDPWVAMVMIQSLDGAAEIEGLSGGLGRPADKSMFAAMRDIADVVLVGGATARAEDYGPALYRNLDARRERGQAKAARIAVISGSLNLDPSARLFGDPERRPLLYTGPDAPEHRQRELQDHADIVILPDVSPTAILADLAHRGLMTVVLEGGPSVNAQFVAAGLVDEVQMSLAPMLVGGDARRIVQGPDLPDAAGQSPMVLTRVWEGDGIVFTRHVRPVEAKPYES